MYCDKRAHTEEKAKTTSQAPMTILNFMRLLNRPLSRIEQLHLDPYPYEQTHKRSHGKLKKYKSYRYERLRHYNFDHTKFTECDFSYANIVGKNLETATFLDCTFHNTSFSNCTVRIPRPLHTSFLTLWNQPTGHKTMSRLRAFITKLSLHNFAHSARLMRTKDRHTSWLTNALNATHTDTELLIWIKSKSCASPRSLDAFIVSFVKSRQHFSFNLQTNSLRAPTYSTPHY